jgi:hypothetical protein
VDLAVIASDGKPSCLVELKACYTFDALEKEPWFVEPVSSDLVKIARYDLPAEAGFALVLGTHVHGSVPRKYREAVKYAGIINKAYRRDSDSQSLRVQACAAIAQFFPGRITFAGELNVGEAFGLGVTMHYWLVRAPD